MAQVEFTHSGKTCRPAPTVSTLHSSIDHLVVTAPTLEIGAEFVRDTLGVTPQAGGEHPRMGTHNCLLRLGEALYLEVLSINPAAGSPDRPRWFQLDRDRLNAAPRLTTWISRTNDIRSATAAAPFSLGNIENMNRGPLRWQITIPLDGGLPFNGIAPSLIQWHTNVHPAATLKDSGCSLAGLEAFHSENHEISGMLQSIGFEGQFRIFPISPKESPRLVAHIRTPAGLRQLRTR